ncbi:unnamed protein product [Victoria cruziana]
MCRCQPPRGRVLTSCCLGGWRGTLANY